MSPAVPETWSTAVAAVTAAMETGRAEPAEAAARRALAAATDDSQMAVALRLLGDALRLGGDREGARAALMKSLELSTALPDRPELAAMVHNSLGVLEKHCGNLDAAASHYEAVLGSGLEDDPRIRAMLLHNLGGLAHSRRDLPTAERHTREALALHESIGGSASPGCCADRGQLGSIVSSLGRHDEALELLRATVDGFSDVYGPDHLEVGIALCTLGAALDRARRFDEAEACYRDGLAIRERASGPGHPELAASLLNLGQLLDRRGERTEAQRLARRAFDNLTGQVDDEHPFLLEARRRVADIG